MPTSLKQIEEQARLLLRCIQGLPAKHQEVVYLRFYVNNSLEEIAAARGLVLANLSPEAWDELWREAKRSAAASQGV